MVELGAVVSTSQVWEAGEASVLPAVSVARTWKVWLPSARRGVVLRAGAGAPGAAVDAALEGRACLVGGELEVGVGGGGGVGRADVDRRLRRRRVVGERPRRAALDVAGVVGRAHVQGVAAVGGEVGRGEGERPVASGRRRREVRLAGGVEGVAVPVEVGGVALDADLHLRHAGACVGVRAAAPARRAAGVPAGGRVARARRREREERARVGVVDRERPRRPALRVARVVGRADVDDVLAVGREARRREGVGPVAPGSASP